MGAMIYLAVVYKKKSDADKTADLKAATPLSLHGVCFHLSF